MRFLALFLLVARLGVPGIFSDNMVVQQKSTITIPGHALPGTEVTVDASWGRSARTVAAADSTFALRLRTPKAGGPYVITIKGGEDELVLSNVLSGEVWLCSGQSNMEMPVAGWGKVNNYEEELQDACNHPDVRVLRVIKQYSFNQLDDPMLADGGWCVSDSACIAEFSAIGYFFGRELQKMKGVPVGIIGTSWGGTPLEAWCEPAGICEMDEYSYIKEFVKEDSFDGDGYEDFCNHRYDDLGFAGLHAEPGVRYDDWTACTMPLPFSRQNLDAFDGQLWYQCVFDLPEALAGKDAVLSLGVIDSIDDTYINGRHVGQTDSYEQARLYKVDGGLLKQSGNLLSIKVTDNSGEGGFLSSADLLYIEVDGQRISLAGEWKLAIAVDYGVLRANADGTPVFSATPTLLFNAMIYPFRVMPVRGFLWYQGCTNVGRDEQYARMFPRLVNSWRKLWNDRRKPFYFVQLASYLEPQAVQPDSKWAALRHSQTSVLKLRRTGMAVATDVGNPNDIHPKNKQEVARRLLLMAGNDIYGNKCISRAPQMRKASVKGGKVTVKFSGDVALGNELGWVLGTADGEYHAVTAVAADGRTVTIDTEGLGEVTEVLYNWADYAQGLLACSKSGLPVAPFRTSISR